MDLKPRVADGAQGVEEVVLRLAGEARDDVRGEVDIRDRGAEAARSGRYSFRQ